MIIGIDYDDTLNDRTRIEQGHRLGPPTPGAIAATRRLHMEGHTLIIFTAWNVQDPRLYKTIKDWCTYWEIPIHGITNIKRPDFDVVIDNIAIHFDTWPQVLMRLTAFQNEGKILP